MLDLIHTVAAMAVVPMVWTDTPLTRHTMRAFVVDALHGFEEDDAQKAYVVSSDAIVAQIDRPLTEAEGVFLAACIRDVLNVKETMRVHRIGRVFR